jgi:hypothetical protein
MIEIGFFVVALSTLVAVLFQLDNSSNEDDDDGAGGAGGLTSL